MHLSYLKAFKNVLDLQIKATDAEKYHIDIRQYRCQAL